MKYLLLLFISLSACAPKIFLRAPVTNLPIYQCKLPIKVYLDRSVLNYDYYTIKSEVEYWNEELGTKVFIFKGYQGYFSSVNSVIIHALFNSNREKQTRGTIWNLLSDKGCIIFSDIEYHADRINRNYRVLDWVFRHEIGHSLGLSHFDKENDLMDESFPYRPIFVPRVNKKQKEGLKNIYNLE